MVFVFPYMFSLLNIFSNANRLIKSEFVMYNVANAGPSCFISRYPKKHFLNIIVAYILCFYNDSFFFSWNVIYILY